MNFLSLILGAVALLPAPLPDLPPPQVVWPVIITCNSNDPNATLDTCSIALTNMDISSQMFFSDTLSRPLQSFVAGFQCRKGIQ